MTGRPEPPPRAFAWKAEAWFGSQLGSTLWMVVAAGILLARAPLAASVVLGVFLLLNAVGLTLWSARARLDAHRGMQLWLWSACLGAVVCLFALGRLGGFEALPGGAPHSDVKWSLAVLGVTALLSALFWHRARAFDREAKRGERRLP